MLDGLSKGLFFRLYSGLLIVDVGGNIFGWGSFFYILLFFFSDEKSRCSAVSDYSITRHKYLHIPV